LNTKRRPREYLTVKEVGKLVEGARSRGRWPLARCDLTGGFPMGITFGRM
jgi:hypothetical protein